MNASKHTQGPWMAENCVVYAARQNEMKAVAIIESAFHNGDGEPDANAALIAAAPDLLAACRILEEFVAELTKASEDRQNRLVELEGDRGNRLFTARAAIAKAEGKQ